MYAQGYFGHGIATIHVIGEIMANTVSSTLAVFDVVANVRHWRVPLSDRFGNSLPAAGMWNYQMLEKLR